MALGTWALRQIAGGTAAMAVVQFIDELPNQSAMEVLSKSEIQRATAIFQVAR
jgi:hypothetical protein